MNSAADRLQLFAAILSLIEESRSKTGDETLGAEIERTVIESQFRELEADIFEDPGAIEPWLLRRRREAT